MEKSESCQYCEQDECLMPNFPHGFPCGIMRCSCEKYPRVIYANQWVFELLGFGPDSEEWKNFLRDNVYFMLPSDEWPAFRRSLQEAERSENSVSVEHQVKTKSGEKVHVMGWVRMTQNSEGEKQFVFLYICLSHEQFEHREKREKAYLQILGTTYDGVFKVDRQNQTVECLSIRERLNSHTYFMQGMRVVLDCLLQKSYYMLVYGDDRLRVQNFFRNAVTGDGFDGSSVKTVEFRTTGDGILKEFILAATELDHETVILCFREVTDEKSARRRKEEKMQMRSINARMGDKTENAPIQMTIYQVMGDTVFTQSGDSDYLMDSGISLQDFLLRENITAEQYQQAVANGEAELTYGDPTERRHLYLAHRSIQEGEEKEDLMLIYRFANTELLAPKEKPRVTIHTFGFFDVHVDGQPIVFPHEKSKEMLALMVDRKGSFVGNPYFISCLWEDEPYSEKIQSRCRQTVFRMMETLKKYGIEDIIEKVDGHRRIIPEKVSCDYFDYINGKPGAKQLFNGTYMSDYSWGEETLSTLLRSTDFAPK